MGIALVGDEYLKGKAKNGKANGIEQRRSPDQQLQPGSHGSDVRTEIEGVCEHEESNHWVEQPGRIVPSDVPSDAAPGDAANASTDLLDRTHQGKGKHHRPEEGKPKGSSGLRVRRYATWIIIRSTSDQTWAKTLKQRLFGRSGMLGWWMSCWCVQRISFLVLSWNYVPLICLMCLFRP